MSAPQASANRVLGGCGEGLDKLQVIRRRDDRDVPHVVRQERQLGLHVHAGAGTSAGAVTAKRVENHACVATGPVAVRIAACRNSSRTA